MNYLNRKAYLLLCLLLVVSTSSAEDIELYVGSASKAATVKPNILFVVDTSGSMSTRMDITIPKTTTTSVTTTATTGDLISQTFDSGVEGWDGAVSNYNQTLVVGHDVVSSQTFDFGNAYANASVSIIFSIYVNSAWETSGWARDYFTVTANGSEISKASYDDYTTTEVSASFNLDADGKVVITLAAETTASNEYALIDDLKVGNAPLTGSPFAYSSSSTYAGCHDSDKIYNAANVSDLACSGTYYQSNYVPVSKNKCDYLTRSLNSYGYASGVRGGVYNTVSERWENLSASTSGDFVYECRNDRGVHGETAGSNARYAANRGPWTTSWWWSNWFSSNTYSSKNHYSGNYLNYLDCVSTGGCSTGSSAGGTTGTTTTTTTTVTDTTLETVRRTRLQVAQYVINDIVNTTSNINIGLMRFDSQSRGGFVVTAMDDIATNKAAFQAELDKMAYGGGTPLAETLYEAYLYYKGENVLHGVSPYGNSYSRDSTDSAAYSGSKYISPIEYQCQKSFIVLLTDGAPSGDTGDDDRIESITDFRTITGRSGCSGNCLDEISSVLNNSDLSTSLSSDQVVSTYTIAMGDDIGASALNLLNNTATKGGGGYYTANSYTELLGAFTTILNSINSQSASFSAPALSVNAFSRTTSRENLYYSLFKPELGPHWTGNIKKFKLKISNGEASIVDLNGNSAVDTSTGAFFENAQSYWLTSSQQEDGGDVTKGGAAAKIPAPRTVYTNIAGNAITATNNLLTSDNAAALGTAINPTISASKVNKIIAWVRGYDVFSLDPTQARMEMGDPLHTQPVVIQYGGTEANPDLTIYSTNNDGFLNAINETTGVPLWSFIPKELLTNLDVLYDDNSSVARPYGLDGHITAHITDANKDGIVNGNDKVILYIGMRRGGNNYYALDVTSRTAPTLLWTIKGGSGDFAELGQTWSPVLVKEIKFNGSLQEVLIFAGGYDTNQDSNNVHDNDLVGRAVYIVDPVTGSRLWWAGPTGSSADHEMATLTNGIVSSVLAIDVIQGAGVNRMYLTDTRGQILRLDVNPDNTGAADLIKKSYRLAKLSDENDVAGTRRTYYSPDISVIKGYIALVIGTGYRSHPLEVGVQDRIFMIKDVNVYVSPEKIPDTIVVNDLVNTTLLPTSASAIEQRTDDLANADGWYFNLDAGEKVLSKALVVNKSAILTSFTPTASTASTSCSAGSGTAKAYLVSLETSGIVKDLNNDGSINSADRSVSLPSDGGIPAEANKVVLADGTSLPLIGTQIIRALIESNKPYHKTYWYEDKTGGQAQPVVAEQ